MTILNRHFDTDLDGEDVEELKHAIKVCSPSIRFQIFTQARKVRTDNWHSNIPLMERTIPVFEALIENETEGEFHRNHAQLGYALKDQQEPDWSRAKTELEKAIELRDKENQSGYLMYEFNHAICVIKLDQEFSQGNSSSSSNREIILKDLCAAGRRFSLRKLIETEDPIVSWVNLNDVDLESECK